MHKDYSDLFIQQENIPSDSLQFTLFNIIRECTEGQFADQRGNQQAQWLNFMHDSKIKTDRLSVLGV
jgi:hypothetical protein